MAVHESASASASASTPGPAVSVAAAAAALLLAFPASLSCGIVSAFVPPPATNAGIRKKATVSSPPSRSPVTRVGMARRGRRVHPPDGDHDDIMNYLAQSEARAGGGLGFEYPNHPNPHTDHPHASKHADGSKQHQQQRRQRQQPKEKQRRYQEYAWSSDPDPTLRRTMLSERTMSSSLAIIPPDGAWDTLQRARHLGRDHTYHRWPPAIRLFHPYAPRVQLPSAAIAIAEVVERYGLEPFEVTLDQLLILPHFEVLDEQVDASAEMVRRHSTEAGEERLTAEEEGRREVMREIEEEERTSKAKMIQRMARKRRKMGLPPEEEGWSYGGEEKGNDSGGEDEGGGISSSSNNYYLGNKSGSGNESPQDVVDRQRAERAEFNGPCVVCLEPNSESRAKLERLREILRRELFGPYDAFSASSGVSSTDRLPLIVEEKHRNDYVGDDSGGGMEEEEGGNDEAVGGATFRPVLTLGRFPTVSRAVAIAKKLQALWEPLTFTVSDLSLISRADSDGPTDAYGDVPSRTGEGSGGTPGGFSIRRIRGTEHETESALLSTRGRYGCDAMVALVGAEGGEDEVGDEDLLNLLMSEAGEKGGGAAEEVKKKLDYEALLSMSDAEEDIRRRQARVRWDGDVEVVDDGSDGEDGGWEEWLLDDDEWDEGATIVIGRTQFFMGEARQYVGMPAASTMDGKDRVLGEGVSGAARRKGAVHRKGDRFQEGDFGRKEKDYLA